MQSDNYKVLTASRATFLKDFNLEVILPIISLGRKNASKYNRHENRGKNRVMGNDAKPQIV